MLPILEDTRLAQRWSEGHLSIDALLSYSAVCGTDLDTVPLPGDITADQLSLINRRHGQPGIQVAQTTFGAPIAGSWQGLGRDDRV